MSIKITGEDDKTVKKLQSRLDKFFSCDKAHEEALKRLNECAAEQIELANIPAHEDRYQTLLSQYKISAEALKARAEKTARKTNEKHTDKYFKKRHNSWFGTYHYYINPDFSDYVKGINQEAQKLLAFDFETHIAQLQNASLRKKTAALSSIEFASIDQTFPSRSAQLLKENPVEYLRQASLYQQKLLEKKDETAVLAFGNAWIQNLPKDASWDQIENMSFIMLEAAKTQENTDLNDYQVAVEKWLKEHPLTETPDSVDPSQATSPWGRRTYLLGRLYVHHHDLSPEAFQIYQRCGSLYPDLHGWKVFQAQYHISRLEWLEAEQLLADLPKEDPLVRDTQRDLKVNHARYHIAHRLWVKADQALADLSKDDDSVRETQRDLNYYLRERISSAVMDVGVTALSKYMPSSYREKAKVDVPLTGLQLVTSETVRQMWVPRLLGIPDRATSPNPLLLPLSSSLHLAGDVVDCAFRNIAYFRPLQSYESFLSYTLRMGHAAWTLRDTLHTAWKLRDPLQLSLPAVINLGSLCIASGQSLDSCRGIRRSAVTQASLSSLQQMASDITFGVAIASYSDLLPVMASSIGANSLADRISFDLSSEGEGSSRGKWVFGALVIGSVAVYRLYCDYPYLWAASVMSDIELYYSQGKHEEVQRVLAETESKYFVSSVRPAVRDYALYAKGLKDYPSCLEDPAGCREFQMQLDLVLNTLKASSHYRGIRNNLLEKKMEAAIRKQDRVRLEEVYKEGPEDKIAISGFHFFLNSTFSLALSDLAAACSLIVKMKPAFTKRFHPATDSFLELLQDHSESLEEWSQLNLLAVLHHPPSSEKIQHWNSALQELQSFFSENVGKTGAYQNLQYSKLILAFSQASNEQVEALFKEFDPELHQKFSYELVLYTRLLWKAGDHKAAIRVLKRVQFNSFKENALMQNYGHFFSQLYSPPLQENFALQQITALESCMAGLDAKNPVQQALQVFFSMCRIVLYLDCELVVFLDAGEYVNAPILLVQETTDSKVPDEVAALLFERMHGSLQKNGAEKAQSELKGIVGNLGSWKHLELFKAFQAYLSCEPSEVQQRHLASVITHLTPIDQLSDFAYHFQLLLEFKFLLSQGNFTAAKNLLTPEVPTWLYSDFCNTLFIFFIHRGQQHRQAALPLRRIREDLQALNDLFDIPNSDMIPTYLNFLVLLENAEEKREIAMYEKASQSLRTVFGKLHSIRSPIPLFLKGDMVEILLQIVILANKARPWQSIMAEVRSITKIDDQIKYLDEQIIELKRR